MYSKRQIAIWGRDGPIPPLGAEFYKWCKRIVFRRLDAKKGKEDYSQDVEDRVFQRYMTQSSTGSGSDPAGEKV